MYSNVEDIDKRFRELILEGEEHVKAHAAPDEKVDMRLAHGWTAAVLNLDFITAVHAKRLEEAAGLRNKAFHAKWSEFDLRDVGSVIRTVHELIEQHLNR